MDDYYATTLSEAAHSAPGRTFIVKDCNRGEIGGNLRSLAQITKVMWTVRPDVVVSTGAAPGLFAIAAGRLFGARTIWIDSVANSERLSMSGRLAGFIASQHLTQWPHLSRPKGPRFIGSVL